MLLIRNGRIVGEVKNNFEPMDVQDYENYLPKITADKIALNKRIVPTIKLERALLLKKSLSDFFNELEKSPVK